LINLIEGETLQDIAPVVTQEDAEEPQSGETASDSDEPSA
jgi:hypothetical protein